MARRLKVDEGDKIKRGQRIAEWDPYTRPIITEIDGVVGFEDLVEGASMTETVDEATGIAKRMVMDWRAQPAFGEPEARDRHQGPRTARSASCSAAATRAICCRSTRSSRSIPAAR